MQQIVHRGSTNSARFRRTMMVLASTGGNRVPAIANLVATATTRPTNLDQPFARWSIRKLTKTWKESTDPERDAKLDRVERVLTNFPDRTFAFRRVRAARDPPAGGACWAEKGKSDRVAATCHRTHGVTYVHGCYSVGDDMLWGINH